MPVRKQILSTGEIYHVFNRGIDRRKTFIDDNDYLRAIKTISFYRFPHDSMKLSRFLELSLKKQAVYLESTFALKPVVRLICFCLMPNHFHLLIRQETEGATSRYMSNVQNSYTKYFNTRIERNGQLFMNQFKAVRIESEEQLLHVSRYIHLNPYSASLVKTTKALETYLWSSFRSYIKGEKNEIDQDIVLASFGSREKYREFVLDNADHQRLLKINEHLAFE